MDKASGQSSELRTMFELSLGTPIGMMRAFPVRQGAHTRAMCAAYCADFDVDPSLEMFFCPSDTLKFAVFSDQGDIIWRRDLGRSVIPGIWFCPIYPFDLDGDGVDEIWYVHNLNEQHPLSLQTSFLERLDGTSGETVGQWPWTYRDKTLPLSHLFRNFILGGYVHGQPVLVTAQGTYSAMHLQGWNSDMSPRWQCDISAETPGARGSHMCPVIDWNNDGVDEVFWGERCIELDTGTECFCGDRDVYKGHSDVIQPVLDRDAQQLFLYTVRENDPQASPRVVLFGPEGQRVWGDVDHGHMDMGWVARLGDDYRQIAMAIRIGSKTCGPDGRFHQDMDEFVYDALSGQPYNLPFSVYRTVPVDLDGDGYHELVRGIPGGDGHVFDRHGRPRGTIGGTVAMASKFLDHPGEQILAFYPDGTVRAWADPNAEDTPAAYARYQHPFYQASQRLTGVGYNLCLMSGL